MPIYFAIEESEEFVFGEHTAAAPKAVRLFARVATLLVALATIPVAAQTVDEAVAAHERGDFATALRGFQSHAEQGDAFAQSNLGFMYYHGEGVPENDSKALRWFRLAAEQGDASAQLNLGVMYANGEGVPEDTVNAYAWCSIAAAQGNTSAKELKEAVTGLMARSQIAEAQKLSREHWTLYVLPFQ